MESDLDLVLEAFVEMSPWGTLPDDCFSEKMQAKFPAMSATEIRMAVQSASQLQRLVGTNQFQNEPYGKVRERIANYLRTNAPGLSENTYLHAENRMIFMYIK